MSLIGSTTSMCCDNGLVICGFTDGSATEVLEGLEEGDRVITSAYLPAAGNGAANPFGGSAPRR